MTPECTSSACTATLAAWSPGLESSNFWRDRHCRARRCLCLRCGRSADGTLALCAALAIAEGSRDHCFYAYVTALMVNQALALEAFKTAEILADIGLRSSAKMSPTPLSIDLRVRKEKALASSGDIAAARSALHRIEAEVGKLPEGNGVAEASYAQEGHLQATLAEALTGIGDLAAAHRYAEQSLASEGHARGKSNRLATMATLEVARGEIERASHLACQMIESAQGMDSQRLVSRFRKLRGELAGRPAVVGRDAIDRIDSATMLMP